MRYSHGGFLDKMYKDYKWYIDRYDDNRDRDRDRDRGTTSSGIGLDNDGARVSCRKIYTI